VTGPRLIISNYGTLLDVVDAKGKSRFGKLERDGFRVSYKTKNESAKAVYAIGSTSAKGLVPGEVRYHGRSARVTVMSEDKKLTMMSYFTLDENARTLFIRRTIRNTSCEPVLLESTRFSYERSFFPESGGVPMLEDRIDIVRNRKEPAFKFLRLAQVLHTFIDGNKRLLGKVATLFRVKSFAAKEAQDLWVVALIEPLKVVFDIETPRNLTN
jgi:hypothetical protein